MNVLLIVIVAIAALFSLVDAWSAKTTAHKIISYIFSMLFCILGIVIVRGVV